MKLKNTMIGSLLLVTLSACGSSSSNPNPAADSDANDPSKPHSPKYQAHDGSFKQFITTKRCEGKYPTITELTAVTTLIDVDLKGRDVLLDLYVQLHEDSTYEGRVVMHHVTEYLNNSKTDFSYNPDEDSSGFVDGTWVAQNSELVLTGLGRATFLMYNELPALTLTVDPKQAANGKPMEPVILRFSRSSADNVHGTVPCP